MLISLPLRIPAHRLDFGYLQDARTGEPLRHLGRSALRVTADFPEACTAHALPGRLAAHVSGLTVALERRGDTRTALLILPSYGETPDGLEGRHVVLQRILLDAAAEAADRPGDSARASALAFDWSAYGRHAGALVADAARLLQTDPLTDAVQSDARIGVPRPLLSPAPRREKRWGDAAAASRAIVAAVMAGETLRLGAADCADEAAFLAALADALDALPEALRGHVSACAGLTRPDEAFSIAWGRDFRAGGHGETTLGIDPALQLADVGAALFHVEGLPRVAAPPGARYAGELITQRDDAGVLPGVRRWLAGQAVRPAALAAARSAADVVSALRSARTRRAEADRVVAFALAASARDLAAFAAAGRRCGEPAVAVAAQIVGGELRGAVDLDGLALALALARQAAAAPGGGDLAAAIAARVEAELAGLMWSRMLLPEDFFRTVLDDEPLCAATARVLAREAPALSRRMIDSIAVIGLLGPEGDALAALARARLAPRDERARDAWRPRAPDAEDAARALSIYISTEALADRDVIADAEALGRRLIELGRADLVVGAMRDASMRVRADDRPRDAHERALERRRLDVIAGVSSALRGAA